MIKHLASLGVALHLMMPDALAQSSQTIASLDYCADQYVLALSERENIAGLSPASQSSYAYHREQAIGLPQIRAEAETIIKANPDIVVRQWGGGFQAPELLNNFGMGVAQLRFGVSFDIAAENLRHMGELLHAPDKAEDLVQDMYRRLAHMEAVLQVKKNRPRVLYITPGGVSAGAGTFIDTILNHAGVINVTAEGGKTGWPSIDLEDLVLNPPDMIVTGFFDLGAEQPSHWSIARHSSLKALFDDIPTLHLPGRLLSCSAWFSVDAVEQVFNAAHPARIADMK